MSALQECYAYINTYDLDESTIEKQVETLKSWVTANGYATVHISTESHHTTSHMKMQEHLRSIIEFAKARSVLLIYSLTSIYTTIKAFQQMLDAISNKQLQLYFVKENLHNRDAMSTFLCNVFVLELDLKDQLAIEARDSESDHKTESEIVIFNDRPVETTVYANSSVMKVLLGMGVSDESIQNASMGHNSHVSQIYQSRLAYGYIRVSSKAQIDNGSSLDTQKWVIESWCTRNNVELLHIAQERGVSGKNLKKLDELINAINNLQTAQLLIVQDITRLSRSIGDFHAIMKELLGKQCILISIRDNLHIRNWDDVKKANKYVELSAFEIAHISENVHRSFDARLGIFCDRKFTGGYNRARPEYVKEVLKNAKLDRFINNFDVAEILSTLPEDICKLIKLEMEIEDYTIVDGYQSDYEIDESLRYGNPGLGQNWSFKGKFYFQRVLTHDELNYLLAFTKIRHVQRDAFALREHLAEIDTVGKSAEIMKCHELIMDDRRLRDALNIRLGHEGEYYCQELKPFDNHSAPNDVTVIDYNVAAENLPGLWCPWSPSLDGKRLIYNGLGPSGNYVEWLIYLTTRFFVPWGCLPAGYVEWFDEDTTKSGLLIIENGAVCNPSTTENFYGNTLDDVDFESGETEILHSAPIKIENGLHDDVQGKVFPHKDAQSHSGQVSEEVQQEQAHET